jgi:hypothetical protein
VLPGSTLVVPMTCYPPDGGSLQFAPPGPQGCTSGATLFQAENPVDHHGALYANTWACPLGLVPPANLGAAPTCSVEPYASGAWASLPGSPQCEEVYTGTQLRGLNDCFGDPVDGYELLQERVFTTDQTEPVDAGHNGSSNGAYKDDCDMPIDPSGVTQ